MAARLRRIAVASLLALAVLPQMGCANYIFRQFNVDSGESLSLDARQRVVLVTHKGGKTRDRTVVCTEPSPDVFTAAAASGQASGNVSLATPVQGGQAQQSAAGSGAFATSEAAASIAMRTQTIQLLRDGLFRACEAYMNGAIDQHQYNVILLNIDRLMISLLGVDAIGGTAVAPAVAIGAGSSGAVPAPKLGEGGRSGAGSVQSEAIANIVMGAGNHSAVPSLCISLLASGELRLDNPGQHAVLARCDYLLAGTMNNIVNAPAQPPRQYKMSPLQRSSEATPAEAASSPRERRVAGWSTRVERPQGSWTTGVIALDQPAGKDRSVPPPPAQPRAAGHGWDASVSRHVAAH